MSLFRNAVSARDSHIHTLRLACVILGILAAVSMGGWYMAPRDLTIRIPPDLRSGST
ncbi:DUF2895 family protein, partial [Salmonella enterica]|nr:DUF2895 family protein [Salmonella enterica]